MTADYTHAVHSYHYTFHVRDRYSSATDQHTYNITANQAPTDPTPTGGGPTAMHMGPLPTSSKNHDPNDFTCTDPDSGPGGLTYNWVLDKFDTGDGVPNCSHTVNGPGDVTFHSGTITGNATLKCYVTDGLGAPSGESNTIVIHTYTIVW